MGQQCVSPFESKRSPVQHQGLPSKLEARIAVSGLEGEGGEGGSKVVLVVEIPRTEKARLGVPIRRIHLPKRPSDSRLPSPGETIEPEHAFKPG